MPRIVMAGSRDKCLFKYYFLTKCQRILQSDYAILSSFQQCSIAPFVRHLHQQVVMSDVLILAILCGWLCNGTFLWFHLLFPDV